MIIRQFTYYLVKFKIRDKILKTTLYLFPIFLLFIYWGQNRIFAKESNKKVFLISPKDNEEISGLYDIRWYMNYNETIVIPYDIKLYSKNCSDFSSKYIGTVDQKEMNVSADNKFFGYKWNTMAPLLNSITVDDGEYCLTLNIYPETSKTGIQTYANIKINNKNNHAPVLVSSVPDLFIKENEKLKTHVEAADLDGDTIYYTLENAPNFLSIDNNGYIQIDEAKAKIGIYVVNLSLRDSKNLTSKFVFALNVLGTNSENFYENLKIISPDENEVFGNFSNNQIILSQPASIAVKSISFSSDGLIWQHLDGVTNTLTIPFPVNNLEEGKYYLQLRLENSKGDKVVRIIEFSVLLNENLNSRIISNVYEVEPSIDDEVISLRPSLSGKFVIPSPNAKNNFNVFLDEKDITDKCQILAEEFECVPDTDLNIGIHKVRVSLETTNELVFIKEWFFKISSNIDDVITTSPNVVKLLGGEVSVSALIIGLIMIGLILIIIFIPWYIYSIWTRRNIENKLDNFTKPTFAGLPNQGLLATDQVQGYDAWQNEQLSKQKNVSVDTQSESTTDYSVNVQFLDESKDIEKNPKVPKMYTEDDIPEWLREVPSSATPVDASGSKYSIQEPAVGTEPYGYSEYEKADNNDQL